LNDEVLDELNDEEVDALEERTQID